MKALLTVVGLILVVAYSIDQDTRTNHPTKSLYVVKCAYEYDTKYDIACGHK